MSSRRQQVQVEIGHRRVPDQLHQQAFGGNGGNQHPIGQHAGGSHFGRGAGDDENVALGEQIADGRKVTDHLLEQHHIGLESAATRFAGRHRAGLEVLWPSRRQPPAVDALQVLVVAVQLENVTAARGIDGGSYFYAEVLAELNRILGISVKYEIGLFPRYSPHHLITVLPRLNIRWDRDLYSALSFAYLISTDYRNQPYHYLGARLCPIHSGNMEGFSIELLPVSVLFNLEDGQPLLMIELLSLVIWPPF